MTLAGWASQEKMLFVISALTEDANMGMAGMPTINFIELPKKWSGQNRSSRTGSYAYDTGGLDAGVQISSSIHI